MSATSELIAKLRDAGNNGPGISPEDLLAAADALETAHGTLVALRANHRTQSRALFYGVTGRVLKSVNA